VDYTCNARCTWGSFGSYGIFIHFLLFHRFSSVLSVVYLPFLSDFGVLCGKTLYPSPLFSVLSVFSVVDPLLKFAPIRAD